MFKKRTKIERWGRPNKDPQKYPHHHSWSLWMLPSMATEPLQVWVNSELRNGLFRLSRWILNATMNILTRGRQKKRHRRGAGDMTTEAETENIWPEPNRWLIPLCSWGYMGWLLFFLLRNSFGLFCLQVSSSFASFNAIRRIPGKV